MLPAQSAAAQGTSARDRTVPSTSPMTGPAPSTASRTPSSARRGHGAGGRNTEARGRDRHQDLYPVYLTVPERAMWGLGWRETALPQVEATGIRPGASAGHRRRPERERFQRCLLSGGVPMASQVWRRGEDPCVGAGANPPRRPPALQRVRGLPAVAVGSPQALARSARRDGGRSGSRPAPLGLDRVQDVLAQSPLPPAA